MIREVRLERRDDGWFVEVMNGAGNCPAFEKGGYVTRSEAYIAGSKYLAWLESLDVEEAA